jgi:chromosome partitioning protein
MEKHVVTLATMKGGSGKSTMAVCLAAHWWHTGRRVALIDADPQESVVRWRETGTTLKDLHCVSADGAGIASTIDDLLQRGFDRVVVDTPGFRSPVTDIAVGKAGLCLIPVRPSPVDFEVAADEVELIVDLKAAGSEGPVAYRFVLSQLISAHASRDGSRWISPPTIGSCPPCGVC